MKSLFTYFIICIFCLSSIELKADTDSLFIRVHFLHGSKPKRKFRYEEDRWFGGMLGGHAGIEIEKNVILNFGPRSGVHVFSKPRIINSRYFIHDTLSFYQVHSDKPNPVKKTIITIPISSQQKVKLDSLSKAYLENCPYDYAFFGMRCGAAAYDVLAEAGVVRKFSFRKTWRKIFYPRRLRRRLEHAASAKSYLIHKSPGSSRRRWEKD